MTRGRIGTTALALLAVVAVLPLGGCSSSPDLAPGVVRVVASTNAWGSVAAAVGGRWVAVTSLIDGPNQDPHSFQASARTLLAVKQAGLVIENGGGYDDFMAGLVASAHASAPVINAVDVSGHRAPPGGALNEHVWYDLASAGRVADRVSLLLGRLEPAHRGEFERNAARFRSGLERLQAAQGEVRDAWGGTPVAITEPVPLYLLEAMQLPNLTPPEFSESIEESGDVSPRSLADMLALLADHKVALLVYNEQSAGPVTVEVRSAAEQAGIPVIPVTETMPPGKTYLTWMADTIDRIRDGLARR